MTIVRGLSRRGVRAAHAGAMLAALALEALCLAPAVAQDAADADTASGDTIYVYGDSIETTLPQELASYGSELVSLGRDDVEEKVYVDPQQMLQMEVPGLYMTSAGPFSYDFVSIQGSRLARYGPSDVLWLVDGVRLNNRLYPSTNPDTLPGNMVERVEVLKGGESLFYGTSAAGGVLNISRPANGAMTLKQVGWLALVGLATGLAAELSAYDLRVLASAAFCHPGGSKCQRGVRVPVTLDR